MDSKFFVASVFSLVALASLAACSDGGSSAAPPNNVPRFAYAANYLDNTVSVFTVNAATGQLRHNGYIAAGTNPRAITVDPSGKFAYVANDGSSSVSAYTINASTGSLTSVGDAITAGLNPYAITVDPSGRFAYVANANSDDISAYSIDASSGELARIACVGICSGSNFPAGDSPVSITIAPSGRFAYIVNSVPASVWVYAIDTATGVLSGVGAPVLTGGANSRSITIDPSGSFAYVTNAGPGNGSISAYSVDATTGALSQIVCVGSCNGANYNAGQAPSSVTVDPSGRYAYAADYNSDTVSVFRINTSSGALTSFGTVAAGDGPNSVIVDPSGKFAYVENFISNNVSAYSIDTATGFLTALPTVAGRNGNLAMAMTHGTAAVRYVPKFAYVANYDSDNVSAYTINPDSGELSSIGTVGAQTNPASVSVDPSGKFAYVANSYSGVGANKVSAYGIDASTGALTALAGAPFTAGSSPRAVIVDPSGRFAYVANYNEDTISAYTINAVTGVLTPITCSGGATLCRNGNFLAGNAPNAVTVDPTGKFVLVASYFSQDISAFLINAVTGNLTTLTSVDPSATATGGPGHFSITVDPTGQIIFVANYNTNDISAYSLNPVPGLEIDLNGALVGTTAAAGTNPRSITVDPSGRFVYVANWGSNDISAYRINLDTSVLTQIACSLPSLCNGNNFQAGSAPRAITIDSSGKFAYVANSSSTNVSTFVINATTGALTGTGTALAGTGPHSITTTGGIQ